GVVEVAVLGHRAAAGRARPDRRDGAGAGGERRQLGAGVVERHLAGDEAAVGATTIRAGALGAVVIQMDRRGVVVGPGRGAVLHRRGAAVGDPRLPRRRAPD